MRNALRVCGASLILLFVVAFAETLAAQTSFSEPFDYAPPGVDLLGQNGGSGFAGPWFASGFNASIHDNYDIAAGSLSFPAQEGKGTRMETGPTGAIAGLGREFAAPITSDATVTIYFSLLARPEGVLGQGVFNGFFGAYLDGTGDADLFVGKPGSDVAGNYVLENRGGSGQVPSGVPPSSGETVLLVVRADLQPGADIFTLYVNPDPCLPEPEAGTMKTDLDLGDVTAVVIYSTGAFSLDDLRLGATFEEVVTCPVSEPFDYVPPGTDLQGKDGGTGFLGPWFASGFNASIHDNYDIAPGSLTLAPLLVTGNRVSTAPTGAIAGIGRNLAVPILAGSTTTRYFSFLLRPEGPLGQGAFNGFFGAYLDGTGDADLFVGKPGSDVVGNYVLENRGGSGQVQSGVAPVSGKTTLLVVRAELQPGADIFSLYVNPDPCEPEPPSGAVKIDLDLGDVTAVVIYSTGAFSLDELRLGSSFESVLGAGEESCVPPESNSQIPSDCNQDGALDLSDGVCILSLLFLGTLERLPCGDGSIGDPGNVTLLDSNGDGGVDLSDAVRVFGYLFLGSPPPVLGTECANIIGCPDGPACHR